MENITKELIHLYDLYLADTIQERTVMMFDYASTAVGAKKEVILRGDLDGFINWLRQKSDICNKVIQHTIQGAIIRI